MDVGSNEKQNWIFTFGSNQPHAGKYVKIYGTWGEARMEMLERYGRNWGFQYSEADWNAYVEEAKEYARQYLGSEKFALVETELI